MDVFTCCRCGHCCHGKGGITLREKDAERLAAFFGLSVEAFHERFSEESHGKRGIVLGADGACVFFGPKGCSAHAARPDVCRAWPFFRGNLIDSISLTMAKQGCLGIRQEATFPAFRGTGARYLLSEGLFVSPGENRPPVVLLTEAQLVQIAGESAADSGIEAGSIRAGEVQ